MNKEKEEVIKAYYTLMQHCENSTGCDGCPLQNKYNPNACIVKDREDPSWWIYLE